MWKSPDDGGGGCRPLDGFVEFDVEVWCDGAAVTGIGPPAVPVDVEDDVDEDEEPVPVVDRMFEARLRTALIIAAKLDLLLLFVELTGVFSSSSPTKLLRQIGHVPC